MAEVILFRPTERYSTVFYRYPLGLVYVATPLVNKGYKVKIIDMETCPDWLTTLKNSVDSSTICAGISVMTGYQIKGALDFSKALKEIKKVPIIWGGLHPSLLPAQTLENDLVDIALIGEGDERFLQLVEKIYNNESIDNINGIMYKQNGKIRYTQPEVNFLNLDTLSIPAYELIDFEYYSSKKRRFMGNKKRVLDLNPSRGCPNRCAFCYNLNFNKRRWRMMSAARLLEIIEELKRRYNVDAINFVADNFFVDKKRTYEICKGIIDRKFDIRWHSDIRMDTFLNYENDLTDLIKRSGCSILTFGAESGSNRILEMIQKDITVDDILKAHKKAKDFGFMVNYHFMVGFPEETKRDVVETMKLIEILKRDKNVTIYGPSTYVPYPGTPLYERCIKLGFEEPARLEDWIDYDFDETSKLPWFTKNYKEYLREVWFILHSSGEGDHGLLARKNLMHTIYKYYCNLRFIGMIHHISLFNFEDRLVGFLIFFKKRISEFFSTLKK